MSLATVTRNYQITIPRDVRELEGIHVGDKLIVITKEDDIVIRKMKKDIIERTFGSWKSKGSGVEYVRKIRGEWETRAKRLGV